MRFIDKTKFRAEFDIYTRDYLMTAWNGQEFMPALASDTSFNSFSQKRWKYTRTGNSGYNGWLEILLQETEGRCCYCMRRLKSTEVSVEHIMPEKFTNLDEDAEVAFYETAAPYLHDNVMAGSEFDRVHNGNEPDYDTIIRMPHLVAHGNLFAACDTKDGCGCNCNRGNTRILPMMLMDDVEQWTEYTPDGEMLIYYHDIDMASATLEALDINSDTLKGIRHLWYLFSVKQIQTHSIADDNSDTTIRDSLLRQAIGLNDTEVIPLSLAKFITDDFYWKLLLKYDWFYDYYRP